MGIPGWPPVNPRAMKHLTLEAEVLTHSRKGVAGLAMRRFERNKTDIPAVIKGASDGISRSFSGHCVNLSESGAGCIVSRKLKVGDFVLLELALPYADRTLLISAHVRHCTRYYCGLAFVAPSQSVTTDIRLGFSLPAQQASEVTAQL
jgi:hypothetical protein